MQIFRKFINYTKKSDIISEKYYIDKVLNIIYVIIRHIQVMKLKKKKYIK